MSDWATTNAGRPSRKTPLSGPARLTEPTAIAIHTVGLSGARPADRVLVTGAGPVGLLTVAVLADRGVTDITVSEPSAERRARALEVGAASVVEPGDRPEAIPDRFPLEREIGFLLEIEEGRRIGARASHVAAMLASVPILRKACRSVSEAAFETASSR